MADSIEPLIDINVANLFTQLHDTALKQAKSELPAGFVLKNLAFADDKTAKMKAGEYLITVAPEDENDKTLFLDDKTRKAAEAALIKYIKFFVNKDINAKDIAEIKVNVQDAGDTTKKDIKDNKQDSNANKKKTPAESLKFKTTRSNLLTSLFDEYSDDMLFEEGEDKKDEKTSAEKGNEKAEEKDNAPKAAAKVRGLSVKYTCKLAGEKTGSLAGALKKGAKSLFGGIWNDLTQIKITGGVFGKDGLAVGKVLDPDAWKEATGRPDIDANTIKSDIDAVMMKDYPNNRVAVGIKKCTSMLSLLQKNKIKITGELRKVLTECDFCITIKVQKEDENYKSYNESSIAEVLNKSIGNYYKSILTHPLKFTISDKDVFKVENFNDENKEIGAPKDKQTPTKPSKESMSFLAYCKLYDLIVEEGEDGKKQDSIIEKVNAKLLDQVRKNINVDEVADDYQPSKDDVLYGTLKEVIDKVKWLKPANSQDISKIETEAGKHKNAFFIDLPVKQKDNAENKDGTSATEQTNDSIDLRKKYAKLLTVLFETIDEADGDISQLLADELTVAVTETMKQLSKKKEIPADIKPIVFNYYKDNAKKNESRLLDFIYNGKLLHENKIVLEKADPIVLKCFDEIDRVGFENISKGIDKFRDEWKKHIEDAKKQLPAELAGRKENSEGYINYLKKKYVKGADSSPFDKNIISKLRKATSTIQVKNIFASYGSNSNETEFNKGQAPDKAADTIPEYYAAWQALKTLPSQKKIKVTFWTSDEDGKKKDEIDTITIVPGKSIDDISDGDNKDTISSFKDLVENDPPEGCRFDGYQPALDTKLNDDTDIIAKYAKKDAPIEIEFYDVDPENPDDESKWKDIDIQELDPESPDSLEFPKEEDLGKHEGWKFEKWTPTEEELKQNPPKTTTKVKATYSKSTVTISLYDADPESGEKKNEPIETYEIEKGTAPNTGKGEDIIVKANEQILKNLPDGFESKGWTPDPSEKVEEDTILVAKYSKNDVTHEVKFMAPTDPDDPSTAEQIGEPQKVKDGESAEAPEPPEVEGWNFDKWDSDKWQNVKDDITVLAEYKKQITITFKVPTDPEKQDGDMENVGDPITYEEGKPISPPDPPPKEGYEFEKWNPDPKELKPEESTDVIGTYKKAKDDEEKEETKDTKVLHEVYVFIDVADLATPQDAIMIDLYAPKDPSKANEKGPIDIGNGKYKKIKSVPIEKGKDFRDQIKDLHPDFTKDGYEFKDWVPAKVKDRKQPKKLDDMSQTGGPVVATYTKRSEEKDAGEGHDLYIYASKKLKYKNEKTVGRKEKKMMNGNAYST